jgi:hypothetical protein
MRDHLTTPAKYVLLPQPRAHIQLCSPFRDTDTGTPATNFDATSKAHPPIGIARRLRPRQSNADRPRPRPHSYYPTPPRMAEQYGPRAYGRWTRVVASGSSYQDEGPCTSLRRVKNRRISRHQVPPLSFFLLSSVHVLFLSKELPD